MMKARVNYNPCDLHENIRKTICVISLHRKESNKKFIYQKTSKTGHKSFFREFPRSTILLFVNFLERREVHIQHPSIDQTKSMIKWKW